MYKKFLLPILFLGALSLASCSENEPEISDDSNNEQGLSKQEKNEVTVYSDGTTSTGVPFRRIDDTTFWLNYIEYQITQDHIEVIDHDCIELENSLNGEVEIYSAITVDGETYPVRAINCWGWRSHYNNNYECPSLKKITIPNSVVSLKTSDFNSGSDYDLDMILGTFQRCSNLEEILLSNNLRSLPDMCFCLCSSLKEITLPDNLTSLGIYCFYGCRSLKEITLPDNLTSLDEFCFGDCSSLEKITFSDNLTSLGSGCFYGCSSLKKITLPDNLTSLGIYCFYDCSSLTEITLPDNLKEIGYSCFYNCSELKKLDIPGSVTTLGGRSFSGCNSLDRLSFADAFPEMTGIMGYPTGIRSLVSFGDKLWIYRNENKKLYTTIVDPEEFNSLIYEMYKKYVFSALYNYYEGWSSSFLCNLFFTIYVPQSALSAYRSYSSELSPWFEGYDPSTFDFEALLAD